MNNDDVYSRNFSVGSDRELDNLSLLRNLDTSHSDLDIIRAKENIKMASSIYDSDRDGRTPRKGNWATEFGTVSEVLDSQDISNADDTPVRKLKSKTSFAPVEREYSDLYLESNLRTPRYNTHTSYEGMLENLNPDDPFDGDYKPSGKPKREKHSHRQSKKDKHMESHSKIPVAEREDSSVNTKVRKSKRKKEKRT